MTQQARRSKKMKSKLLLNKMFFIGYEPVEIIEDIKDRTEQKNKN